MSNFDFLQNYFEENGKKLAAFGYQAENSYESDPQNTLSKCRSIIEFIAKQIVNDEGIVLQYHNSGLNDILLLLRNQNIIDSNMYDSICISRRKANDAIHASFNPNIENPNTKENALHALESAFDFSQWYIVQYRDAGFKQQKFSTPVIEDNSSAQLNELKEQIIVSQNQQIKSFEAFKSDIRVDIFNTLQEQLNNALQDQFSKIQNQLSEIGFSAKGEELIIPKQIRPDQFAFQNITISTKYRIDESDLSARAKNQLIKSGKTYVSDIKDISENKLKTIRGIGQKTINEIKAYIDSVTFDESLDSVNNEIRNSVEGNPSTWDGLNPTQKRLLRRYVSLHDATIRELGLEKTIPVKLENNGITRLSQIVNFDIKTLSDIMNDGERPHKNETFMQIMDAKNDYIRYVIDAIENGELTDDNYKAKILDKDIDRILIKVFKNHFDEELSFFDINMDIVEKIDAKKLLERLIALANRGIIKITNDGNFKESFPSFAAFLEKEGKNHPEMFARKTNQGVRKTNQRVYPNEVKYFIATKYFVDGLRDIDIAVAIDDTAEIRKMMPPDWVTGAEGNRKKVHGQIKADPNPNPNKKEIKADPNNEKDVRAPSGYIYSISAYIYRNNIPDVFYEDRYRELIERFEFDWKKYGISPVVFNFVNAYRLRFDDDNRIKLPKDPSQWDIDELSKGLTSFSKKLLQSISQIELDGEWVPRNTDAIRKHIASRFSGVFTIDEYIAKTLKYIDRYPALSRIIRANTVKSLENYLDSKDFIVREKGKDTYRFWHFEKYNLNRLAENLPLTEYHNIEISAKLLFDHDPDLMQQFDIQNEYELYSILKKYFSQSNEIYFRNIPYVCFDLTEENAKERRAPQIRALIDKYHPTTRELANLISREFGLPNYAASDWVNKFYQ